MFFTFYRRQLGQWVKQMRKYYSWKMEGKAYPKTFTEERIHRLNDLGFEWRLKDGTLLMEQDDQKPEAAMMGVAGVSITTGAMGGAQGSGMDNAVHRQMAPEDVNRYEPFRTNVGIYEQRGWL